MGSTPLVYTSPEVLRAAMADFIRFYTTTSATTRGSATSRRQMCTMAGATQCSDDGRPNNAGRKPSGLATIGPS